MANCDFCGKPITSKDGELQLFVSSECLGNYCSIDCWAKADRNALCAFLAENMPHNKCGECAYIQKWECGSKFFFYCGQRKSKKTENELLKVKCKNTACDLFKVNPRLWV